MAIILINLALLLFSILYFTTLFVIKKRKGIEPVQDRSILSFLKLYLSCKGRASLILKKLVLWDKVVGVKVFGQRIVFLNDVWIAEEVLGRSKCRPQKLYRWISEDFSNGFLFEDGRVWSEQRRFSTKFLNQMVATDGPEGGGRFEQVVQAQVSQAIESIIGSPLTKRKEIGGLGAGEIFEFCPNGKFYIPVLNCLWALLTSQTYDPNDKMLLKIAAEASRTSRSTTQVRCFLPIFWPWVATWFPNYFDANAMRDLANVLMTQVQKLIDQHKKGFEVGQPPVDFIDAFLQESHRMAGDKSSTFSPANQSDRHLVGNLRGFFLAGGDTTSVAIEWSIAHLVNNLDVQQRIQAELDLILGRDRLPAPRDRHKCPYTDSFIFETLRITPPVKTSMLHRSERDQWADDKSFHIAKDDWIFLNVQGIHSDARLWGDPQNFRPERFLNPPSTNIEMDSKSKRGERSQQGHGVNLKNFVGFSRGPRRCPGEKLVLDNLFVFISAICQKFELRLDTNRSTEAPVVCQGNSVLSRPDPFFVVATLRD